MQDDDEVTVPLLYACVGGKMKKIYRTAESCDAKMKDVITAKACLLLNEH